MKVLSLCDGISAGRVALDRLDIPVDKYVAYEIDDSAIKISNYNYPDIIHKGDIKDCEGTDYADFELLLSGTPCQDLSGAKKDRTGLQGEKSSLFFEFVRIKNEMNPKYFLFENVGSMKKEDMNVITKELGVEPVRINSSLVSSALRNRLYWTNLPVSKIEDKGILLQDILESGYTDRKKARALLASDSRPLKDKKRMIHRYRDTGFTTLVFEDKAMSEENCRYMTQIELERCMTFPVGYTQCVKRNQAAFHLGNSWTVDVIVHILKGIK